MLQGSTSQPQAVSSLTNRLREKIKREKFVNIHFSPKKAVLIHLIPKTGHGLNDEKAGIPLADTLIHPSKSITSLGVIMDQRLSFRHHTAKACASASKVTAMIATISKRKGITAKTQHQLVTAMAIPTLLWGSPVWWTGANHILRQMGPTYHTLARHITGLPAWTPIASLLSEAGMLHLELLLDQASLRYGVRILLAQDTHPCKNSLVRALGKAPSTSVSCGM